MRDRPERRPHYPGVAYGITRLAIEDKLERYQWHASLLCVVRVSPLGLLWSMSVNCLGVQSSA